MIDFSKMEVGDKVNLTPGEWSDSLREIFEIAKQFVVNVQPTWQFHAVRVQIGNKSTNPPTKDQYVIERIK